jgi:hypothetical protein
VKAGWSALTLAPGARVRVAGEPGQWRIARWGLEAMAVSLELVQFAEAEPLGANRWRLTRLWRGRRGTEAAIGTTAAGDRFVLIEAAALAAHDAVAGIGASVSVLGTGPADGEGVEAHALVTGASVVPPAPVRLHAERLPDGGALLRWTRRSRVGWRWQDGADTPLGEELERYQIRVVPATGAETLEIVAAPELQLAPERLAAGPVTIELRQSGNHGLSPPALLTL